MRFLSRLSILVLSEMLSAGCVSKGDTTVTDGTDGTDSGGSVGLTPEECMARHPAFSVPYTSSALKYFAFGDEDKECEICLAQECCDAFDVECDGYENLGGPATDVLPACLAKPFACARQACAETCFGGFPSSPCNGECGPTMRRMPEGYRIDETEVTRNQYGEFLSATKAGTQVADQALVCLNQYHFQTENRSFLADPYCEQEAITADTWNASGESPMVCVNWCSAAAYCRWAGKRLCGSIGQSVPNFQDSANPLRSEWESACTSHGGNNASLNNGECNCASKCYNCNWSGCPIPQDVGSFPNCENAPPYDGVFDIVGNAREFDAFGIHGLACGEYEEPNYYKYKRGDWNLGFRCCAD